MVAQTCGKFLIVHHFDRLVTDHVVDVNVQLLTIEVTIHACVAPAMRDRIVQDQVQEQLCQQEHNKNTKT